MNLLNSLQGDEDPPRFASRPGAKTRWSSLQAVVIQIRLNKSDWQLLPVTERNAKSETVLQIGTK